ncbi:MAG: endo-1,4-beta-xylanase, partial [Acutalibacteraceae bacterium]
MNPKENAKIWLKHFEQNRDLMEGRVKEGIEKYRKGYCMLRFVDSKGHPLKGKKVHINQKSHDFQYGANIFMLDEFEKQEDNIKYRELFKQYFNLATVPFYWDALEPVKGKPRFGKDSEKVYRRPAPDLCVEYCEENGLKAKLHCLVYDKYAPDWLPKNDMKAMEQYYEERIRQIAQRYAGRLSEFEVINETLLEHEWKTQSVISEKRDIVEWAFALARKYLPNETLVMNEAPNVPNTAKTDYRCPYFMQVEKCLLNGASIDKLGIQFHMFTGATAANQAEYEAQVKAGNDMVNPALVLKGLDIFAELGLPLEITEVTVPTFGETKDDEFLQAELIKNLYSVFFSHPAIETVVYWNTVDGYAYIAPPSENRIWNENACRGGIFRHDLSEKESAKMIKKLFSEIWHTKTDLTTDSDGYVEFNGFYGDYC